MVASRKIADLEEVAEEIKAKGGKAMAIASHVAKMEESKALIEKVTKEFGRLDMLMNNAGTNPYYGPLMDQDEKTWDITMNVNLKGLFFPQPACGTGHENSGRGKHHQHLFPSAACGRVSWGYTASQRPQSSC